MRAVDEATIAAGHTTGDALMERAGSAVVEALVRRWGSPLALEAWVLCGAGNNGGDGFVIARHLHVRGAVVRVALLAPRERVRGDALEHLGRLESLGVTVAVCETPAALAESLGLQACDLAIDALLGTGATGAPRDVIAAGCPATACSHQAVTWRRVHGQCSRPHPPRCRPPRAAPRPQRAWP